MVPTDLPERMQRYITVASTGCWVWRGTSKRGYGQITVGRRQLRAHRYAYELLIGPIPESLQIDHLCSTPACVNPTHMEPVTQAENVRRAFERARAHPTEPRSQCRNGHPLTVENTYGPFHACRLCAGSAARGKPQMPEHSAKIAAALKGRTYSAETLAKMRASAQARVNTPRPRYRCGDCAFESIGRWLVPHQNETGHTGRIPLDDKR